MYEQFMNILSSIDIFGSISNKFDMLSSFLNSYLSGVDNLRMASIILMILALVMFLFLIIIIYIKSIILFLRNSDHQEDSDKDNVFDEEDALELNRIIEEQEKERELEKELQKELEMARTERDFKENEQKRMKEKEKNKEEEKKKEEQKKEEEQEKQKKQEILAKEKKTEQKRFSKKQKEIDFDWKKGSIQNIEQNSAGLDLKPDILSYHQTHRSLGELTGLVIDMMGRGVDDLKIAQTILYRNHYMSSEEDVLQFLDSIKEFIEICRNNEFAPIQKNSQIPDNETALYHLAEGDPSLALALIEALMDANIDKAVAFGAGERKEALYQQTSNLAVVFGNLSAINDVHLATSSFELAIELEPHNVTAWSRVADMYAKADSSSKAIWAYQNVLNIADGEINAREVANASKNISQHLYAQGNSLQAAKLYNSSKQYYDSLGINRRLDKQEIEIIEIIEANHSAEIQKTIKTLLGREGI